MITCDKGSPGTHCGGPLAFEILAPGGECFAPLVTKGHREHKVEDPWLLRLWPPEESASHHDALANLAPPPYREENASHHII